MHATILLAALAFAAVSQAAVDPPNPYPGLRPASYEAMLEILRKADEQPFVTVSEEAKTTQGRSVLLVRMNRGGDKAVWRIFFIGAQHGDEHAGKDALLKLITDICAKPERLPEDVDLYMVPMANPDGSAADTRRNANGVDLNRDHVELSQPETQALHRIARRVMPHVSVDCHEFGRDSSDYGARGWDEWPLIMMDTANHPLFDPALYEAGLRWVNDAKGAMAEAGFNYCRYIVGDAPPDGEVRHSTVDIDDARNGLGAYGGLSFIIESGQKRGQADVQQDLGLRVAAYEKLLWRFIEDRTHRDADMAAVAAARQRPPGPVVPTNYFWARTTPGVEMIKVIESATSAVIEVPAYNYMDTRVIKKSVPAASAYLVEVAAAAPIGDLLGRHGIAFEVTTTPLVVEVERVRLVRVEDKEDPVYERYANRVIVERLKPAQQAFAAGSLRVDLGALPPVERLRATLLLEPCQMYGLYQYPVFRATVGPDGLLPVARAR
ncbi:MAG: DUF2817 domain-containing protein [Candidatus Sumerlaeaceae bacterium]|nr:DUF2817 domain-containing protein [Candidatus Sumerlaeaceae bacterium]